MMLPVRPFMPLALSAYRRLHNAAQAYADVIFRIDCELSTAQFDAVVAGDLEEEIAIERLRRDLGLID